MSLRPRAETISAAQDPLVLPGFQHFYNLEYDEALAAFKNEAAEHPDSPDPRNHIAQAIIFTVLAIPAFVRLARVCKRFTPGSFRHQRTAPRR